MQTEQFHIRCTTGEVGGYVLMPGDPGRVELIAQRLDNPRKIAENREFTTYTGMIENTPVSVTSTGIGGPSAAIAMEELVALGAHTFIRIGTCGGMQPELIPGTLILASGAIRGEGTSREYLPIEFPAVADHRVLCALEDAARHETVPYRIGIVQSKDSFYGQHTPGNMPVGDLLRFNWHAWIGGGAVASEMETAALFCVAAVRRVRCGAVLQMLWNQERAEVERSHALAAENMNAAIDTAVYALRTLIREDRS